jgi:hypothetical protein
MSTALFILGFLTTAIPIGGVLAKNDSEPQGAAASMILFLFGALAFAVASHVVVSRKTRRVPGKILSLISGAMSAGFFYATLSSVHRGFNFWPVLLAAFLAATSVAAAFVSLSPKAA